jgi:acyl-CoA synthetase (AMP-forming)/AMP-acid ligase II
MSLEARTLPVLVREVARGAYRRPSAICMSFRCKNDHCEDWSFQEYATLVALGAEALTNMGVGPRTSVILALRDQRSFAIAFLACIHAQAIPSKRCFP